MSADPLQLIDREISELENKLDEYQEAKRAILRARGQEAVPDPDPSEKVPIRLDYVNLPPSEAIEKFLDRVGSPTPPGEIIRELLRGGAGINKKRGEHNIRIAIENGIHTGRFFLRGVTFRVKDLKAVQALIAKNQGMVERNPNWEG